MFTQPAYDQAGYPVDTTVIPGTGTPSEVPGAGDTPTGILTQGGGTNGGGSLLFPNPPVYTPVIPPQVVETVQPIPNGVGLSMEGITNYWGVWLLLASITYNVLSEGKGKKYNKTVLAAGGIGFLLWLATKKPVTTDPVLIQPTQ